MAAYRGGPRPGGRYPPQDPYWPGKPAFNGPVAPMNGYVRDPPLGLEERRSPPLYNSHYPPQDPSSRYPPQPARQPQAPYHYQDQPAPPPSGYLEDMPPPRGYDNLGPTPHLPPPTENGRSSPRFPGAPVHEYRPSREHYQQQPPPPTEHWPPQAAAPVASLPAPVRHRSPPRQPPPPHDTWQQPSGGRRGHGMPPPQREPAGGHAPPADVQMPPPSRHEDAHWGPPQHASNGYARPQEPPPMDHRPPARGHGGYGRPHLDHRPPPQDGYGPPMDHRPPQASDVGPYPPPLDPPPFFIDRTPHPPALQPQPPAAYPPRSQGPSSQQPYATPHRQRNDAFQQRTDHRRVDPPPSRPAPSPHAPISQGHSLPQRPSRAPPAPGTYGPAGNRPTSPLPPRSLSNGRPRDPPHSNGHSTHSGDRNGHKDRKPAPKSLSKYQPQPAFPPPPPTKPQDAPAPQAAEKGTPDAKAPDNTKAAPKKTPDKTTKAAAKKTPDKGTKAAAKKTPDKAKAGSGGAREGAVDCVPTLEGLLSDATFDYRNKDPRTALEELLKLGGCSVDFEVVKGESPTSPCKVTCIIAKERLSYGLASTEALGTQLAASEALRLLLEDYDPSQVVMGKEDGMQGGSIQQLEAEAKQAAREAKAREEQARQAAMEAKAEQDREAAQAAAQAQALEEERQKEKRKADKAANLAKARGTIEAPFAPAEATHDRTAPEGADKTLLNELPTGAANDTDAPQSKRPRGVIPVPGVGYWEEDDGNPPMPPPPTPWPTLTTQEAALAGHLLQGDIRQAPILTSLVSGLSDASCYPVVCYWVLKDITGRIIPQWRCQLHLTLHKSPVFEGQVKEVWVQGGGRNKKDAYRVACRALLYAMFPDQRSLDSCNTHLKQLMCDKKRLSKRARSQEAKKAKAKAQEPTPPAEADVDSEAVPMQVDGEGEGEGEGGGEGQAMEVCQPEEEEKEEEEERPVGWGASFDSSSSGARAKRVASRSGILNPKAFLKQGEERAVGPQAGGGEGTSSDRSKAKEREEAAAREAQAAAQVDESSETLAAQGWLTFVEAVTVLHSLCQAKHMPFPDYAVGDYQPAPPSLSLAAGPEIGPQTRQAFVGKAELLYEEEGEGQEGEAVGVGEEEESEGEEGEEDARKRRRRKGADKRKEKEAAATTKKRILRPLAVEVEGSSKTEVMQGLAAALLRRIFPHQGVEEVRASVAKVVEEARKLRAGVGREKMAAVELRKRKQRVLAAAERERADMELQAERGLDVGVPRGALEGMNTQVIAALEHAFAQTLPPPPLDTPAAEPSEGGDKQKEGEKETEKEKEKEKGKEKEKEREIVALRWRHLCGDEVVTSTEGLLKEWEARVGVQTGLTNEGLGRDRLTAQYLLPGGKSRRIAAFLEDGHASSASAATPTPAGITGASLLPHMQQSTHVVATLMLAAFPRLEGRQGQGEEDELSLRYKPQQVVVVPGDTEAEGKGKEEGGEEKEKEGRGGKRKKTEDGAATATEEAQQQQEGKEREEEVSSPLESPTKKGGRKRKSADPTPVPPTTRATRRTRQSPQEEEGAGKEEEEGKASPQKKGGQEAEVDKGTEKEGEEKEGGDKEGGVKEGGEKGEGSAAATPSSPAAATAEEGKQQAEERAVEVYEACAPVLLRVDRLCMRRGRTSLPKLLTIITTVTKAALSIPSLTCLDWGVDVPYPIKTIDDEPASKEEGKKGQGQEEGHKEVAVVLEALGLEREEVLGKARYRMMGRSVMERCSKATHLTYSLSAALKPPQATGDDHTKKAQRGEDGHTAAPSLKPPGQGGSDKAQGESQQALPEQMGGGGKSPRAADLSTPAAKKAQGRKRDAAAALEELEVISKPRASASKRAKGGEGEVGAQA